MKNPIFTFGIVSTLGIASGIFLAIYTDTGVVEAGTVQEASISCEEQAWPRITPECMSSADNSNVRMIIANNE